MSSSSSQNCNSRHLSWLMKSCLPNPNHPQTTTTLRRTTAASTTAISDLPDDLLLDILSRLPLPLPSVSRHWCNLLDSPAFLHLRRRRNLLSSSLFALSFSDYGVLSSSLTFSPSSAWQTTSASLTSADLPSLPPLFSHARAAAIGRKIYLVGRDAVAEFDAWTGTIKKRSPTLHPRKKFAAAAVFDRIYVCGGSARVSAVEEYDPETNLWSVVSESPRKRYGCLGVGIGGIFYVIGGLKFGEKCGSSEAQAYACSTDLYDVVSRVWLRSRAVPGGGCVVAACGAEGCVFVLASHAVEVSFWRFDGRRKTAGFGEWRRMKSPPLPAQVRMDGTVRFVCVGAEDKVALIQVIGCIDDLLRRSGRSARGFRGGLVLIFDCATEEWSRAADLPEVVSRAACACVEC